MLVKLTHVSKMDPHFEIRGSNQYRKNSQNIVKANTASRRITDASLNLVQTGAKIPTQF